MGSYIVTNDIFVARLTQFCRSYTEHNISKLKSYEVTYFFATSQIYNKIGVIVFDVGLYITPAEPPVLCRGGYFQAQNTKRSAIQTNRPKYIFCHVSCLFSEAPPTP